MKKHKCVVSQTKDGYMEIECLNEPRTGISFFLAEDVSDLGLAIEKSVEEFNDLCNVSHKIKGQPHV